MNTITTSFLLPTTAKPEHVWQYYVDLSLRKLWETDLEDFKLFGEMKTGAEGIFKLQNTPEMPVTLSKVIVNQEFTEQFMMPEMGVFYFSHQIVPIATNQYALKSEISLKPNQNVADSASYHFIKQLSDDIIDKTYALKNLVER
ncbi:MULTISPECIES: hypothetical protein [unclassified Gilliamella]|uniref:hypothetical protein n=1 Tax=unclassified Gilliamella TaxID=2685620 RepID=UPI00226A68AD|nr:MULTISPECIES: hypothetical protein [unclassified Gilliamella]MCX8642906.1 hypothetical protein [Gilliamella sp. B3835]MCX8708322.1 hypothetical protein [Gilliamella sp. B3783]MCX8709949.1 hypothetical protein [Gilliamella sp. B3780]MCX8712001.1 hypothetical protein [Gilliamella sp. B3468]MCX8714261.1 hypothetical protein [Gilliamella sp. B3781]